MTDLIDDIHGIIESSIDDAYVKINRSMLLRNWSLGEIISSEKNRKGSISVNADCIRDSGFSVDDEEIVSFVHFYRDYPDMKKMLNDEGYVP